MECGIQHVEAFVEKKSFSFFVHHKKRSSLFFLSFFHTCSGAGNDPASKITITLAFTSVTAGNRF